jgi:uncharacterized RDD family membrane protein YckC
VPGDETDAFGRPLRGDETDAFGAPVAEPAPTWAPPVAATEWQPPAAAVVAAGWWQRVGATLLDSLFVVIAAAILGIALALAITDDTDDDAITGIAAATGFVVTGAYFCALTARGGSRNGQTWGKQAVGIRVVRMDGAPVGIGFAFVREVLVKTLLFAYIAGFILYIPTIVNYLWPLWDPESRALHDKIVRSRVVKA